MNSTNDDATKPIATQDDAAKGSSAKAQGVNDAAGSKNSSTPRSESRTDSRVSAVAEGITSRISAMKNSGNEGAEKGASRSASRSASRTSRTATSATGNNASSRSGAGTFTKDKSGEPRKSGVSRSTGTQGRPAPRSNVAAKEPAAAPRGTGRRVKLTLARLDPWSVMKFSFLVAIAFGLATVIATALIWQIVDGIGLWDQLKQIGSDLNNGKPLPFMEYFEFTKMLSYATIVSVLNVVIITALGTLFAFLYNIVAALLGGLKMTFTDD